MRACPVPCSQGRSSELIDRRMKGDAMLRSTLRRYPAMAVSELQQSFSFSDEHLAMRFGVPIETVQNWRYGLEYPSAHTMKQMNDLLQLDEALNNARSGK